MSSVYSTCQASANWYWPTYKDHKEESKYESDDNQGQACSAWVLTLLIIFAALLLDWRWERNLVHGLRDSLLGTWFLIRGLGGVELFLGRSWIFLGCCSHFGSIKLKVKNKARLASQAHFSTYSAAKLPFPGKRLHLTSISIIAPLFFLLRTASISGTTDWNMSPVLADSAVDSATQFDSGTRSTPSTPSLRSPDFRHVTTTTVCNQRLPETAETSYLTKT